MSVWEFIRLSAVNAETGMRRYNDCFAVIITISSGYGISPRDAHSPQQCFGSLWAPAAQRRYNDCFAVIISQAQPVIVIRRSPCVSKLPQARLRSLYHEIVLWFHRKRLKKRPFIRQKNYPVPLGDTVILWGLIAVRRSFIITIQLKPADKARNRNPRAE